MVAHMANMEIIIINMEIIVINMEIIVINMVDHMANMEIIIIIKTKTNLDEGAFIVIMITKHIIHLNQIIWLLNQIQMKTSKIF